MTQATLAISAGCNETPGRRSQRRAPPADTPSDGINTATNNTMARISNGYASRAIFR